MAALDVAAIMEAIADALVTAGVVDRAYGWPNAIVQKRQAVVGYPTRVDFDMTFARGLESVTVPVWVVCGYPGDQSTRTEVSRLIASATDVKDALDGTLSSSVSSVRVTDCQVETYPVTPESDHMAVRFDVEVLS
jgi:hypothetical protein